MTTRAIPDRREDVIVLGVRALAGLRAVGAAAGVLQNTAARLEAELHDLVGVPGLEITALGKQGELNARRAALTAARATRDAAVQAARDFCAKGIDSLKAHFGRTWNPNWLAAGFTTRSIAVPKYKPLSLVLSLRAYLYKHPEHEVAGIGVTAANADAIAGALEVALHGVDAARVRRATSGANRDAALRQLRKRLTALRCELDLLLGKDDARWLQFGFSVPRDRRAPAAVTDLTATPGLPGQAAVAWTEAPRATHYHITAEIEAAGAEGTGGGAEGTAGVALRDLGIARDLALLVTELPLAGRVRFSVTARNERGESAPVTVELTLAPDGQTLNPPASAADAEARL